MDSFFSSAYSMILESIAEGVVAVDGAGVVRVINAPARRMLLVGDIAGTRASESLAHAGLDFSGADSSYPRRYKLTPLGSSDIAIMAEVYAVQGTSTGYVAVLSDLTRIEKLTEQVSDLWSARSLLEAVIESAEDAISVADEKGNNIIVNPAYTRITGMSREEVINKPVTIDIAEGKSMHLKVQRTGMPVRNVQMKVGPSGRDVLVNVAPIVLDGKIKGSAGIIHDVSEIKRLTEELSTAKTLLRQLKARYTWDDIIGKSPAMHEARKLADKAAGTSATVLISGESGTGKELFAHAIHNASGRASAPFIRVNCSAITESLLEAEMFGYMEGAFTGAVKGGRKGLFREADGGTMFLDEVGELSMRLQSKMLRVLQDREFTPVGGTAPVSVDVRIIAATNADLEERVKRGEFRNDLYFRLNVLPINIVPLRQRAEDIPYLLSSLLFRLNQEYHRNVERVSDEALSALGGYHWPGNVRELINMLGRAMLNMHFTEKVLEVRHLPSLSSGRQAAFVESGPAVSLSDAVSAAEKSAILSALRRNASNRTKAAAELGISIRSLYYKLDKLGIDPESIH